ELPAERGPRILAGPNLTARELPGPGEVGARLSLRQEDAPLLDEDPRRNEDGVHGRSLPPPQSCDGTLHGSHPLPPQRRHGRGLELEFGFIAVSSPAEAP